MRRLALLLTLSLCACAVFDPAEPQELTVSYDGLTLSLTSDKPVLRGSVGIRAQSVVSDYCDPCTPDGDGATLLRLLEGKDYADALTKDGLVLGEVVGFKKARAVVVRNGERRAVVRTFALADIDKPPGRGHER